MRALIAAERLSVGRRSVLLRDVAMHVQRGECWFVLGRNGSGKTTLIDTLLGLLPPLAGQIRREPAIADRSAVGFVPQEQRFSSSLPLTVGEFVSLGLAQQRLARVERSQRVEAALLAMHVEKLVRRNSGQLSLGQRRRVLVARALARRPQLLILDEPTASLDAFGSGQLALDLERLRREEGLALLHVSHDLALARRYATHVALLVDDAVRTGPAAEVFADPVLDAALGARS